MKWIKNPITQNYLTWYKGRLIIKSHKNQVLPYSVELRKGLNLCEIKEFRTLKQCKDAIKKEFEDAKRRFGF